MLFSDVDAFMDEVLAELAAMAAAGTKPTRSGPKPPLTGAGLPKAILAIWCLCFCGMQWHAVGQLCDIPFGTLFTLFSRWTRFGLWRRLGRTWRAACGDTAEPSAVVIDRRSCRSAGAASGAASTAAGRSRASRSVSAWTSTASRWRSTSRQRTCTGRGNAARRYTKGIVPVLRELAGQGFWGSALGDLGYRGKRLARAGEALGITVKAIARDHDGVLIPTGICWVVERSFSWVSNYRRLNTIFERTKEYIIAFVEIAFVSILAWRLKRLVIEEVSA